MAKSIVNIGNFKNGMVPDVIGARDSVVDLVDGWIDRDGELRKRGAKTKLGDYSSSVPRSWPGVIVESIPETPIASWVRIGTNSDAFYSGIIQNGSLDGGASGGSIWYVGLSDTSQPIDFDALLKIPIVDAGGGESVSVVHENTVNGGSGNSSIAVWGGSNDPPIGPFLAATTAVNSRAFMGGNPTSGSLENCFIRFANNPGLTFKVSGGLLDRPTLVGGVTTITFAEPIIPIRPNIPTTKFYNPEKGQVVCGHADRLFSANIGDYGNLLAWTYTQSESVANNYPMEIFDDNAYSFIGSDAGGEITGLQSLGNQLVIIKSDSVYVMNGDVASQGLDIGARFSLVTGNSGCTSFSGNTISPLGVIWANRTGIWIYNGSSLTNIVTGVCDTSWRQLMDDNNTVSYVDNRVIVQNKTTGNTFIYDTSNKILYRQSANLHTNVVSFYTQESTNFVTGVTVPGNYFEVALDRNLIVTYLDSMFNPTVGFDLINTDHYKYDFFITDWNTDYAAPNYTNGIASAVLDVADNNRLTSPRLKVLTQPIDPGYPFTDNRMDQILVSGYMRAQDDPAAPPLLEVSLVGGRGTFIDELEPNQVLEYGFEEQDVDSTQRIPVSGTRSTPATRVLIQEVDNADHDPATDIRIYGIGAEFLEDNTVGNDT